MDEDNTSRTPAIWTTVQLGSLKAAGDYRPLLEAQGVRICEFASLILEKTLISPAMISLDLTVNSAAELGFPKVARYDAVCAAGLARGLRLCPAEVGPALRLVYSNKACWKWLQVAMAPIRHRVGDFIFAMGTDDFGPCLLAFDGLPDKHCFPSDRFLFALGD